MKFIQKNVVYIAWVLSVAATLGSLYFSEVRLFTPCILCWYQRIFMYPLVLIISVGILRKDRYLYQYVLPLSIIGALIAFYQVLLQMGIIPDTISPCAIGVSCITKYVSYFGFITIPVMSLGVFVIITACMLYIRKMKSL